MNAFSKSARSSSGILTVLLTLLIPLVISGCCTHQTIVVHNSVQDFVIEPGRHHLGDDTGNEGVVFEKDFVLPAAMCEKAILHIDFVEPAGPNYELAPKIFINGLYAGSIQPFFPPLPGGNIDPKWQTNPDGSHDYNGDFTASLDVGRLLQPGNNSFKIQNGRSDDDCYFTRVCLKVFERDAPAMRCRCSNHLH